MRFIVCEFLAVKNLPPAHRWFRLCENIRFDLEPSPMPLLRSTFLALSRNRPLRRFSERSGAGRRISSRFVAGQDIESAVEAVRALNTQGIAATLDSLGENISSSDEAFASADVYHRLLDAIAKKRLNANISVKLTQMGMDLGGSLAAEIVSGLIDHAVSIDSFVRVDMEGSQYTEATLDLVRALHARPANRGRVGVVIQAYLRRSAADIATLIAEGIPIRLCKGAYSEPSAVAFADKRDVDANYVRLAESLLSSGLYHGIATHDAAMITAVKNIIQARAIPRHGFEFQMLYGIRRDLQHSLVAEGYNLRVYVPFGPAWYPYFMRRLAERPANVLFLAKNILKG